MCNWATRSKIFDYFRFKKYMLDLTSGVKHGSYSGSFFMPDSFLAKAICVFNLGAFPPPFTWGNKKLKRVKNTWSICEV